MAPFQQTLKKICGFLLYKFPLIDALTLLMLFAERAQNERVPPINPKLVYVYLVACIGCGVLLSAGFKQKAACLVYAGQTLYFAINFYTNPKWDYPEWQKIMMSTRQIGVLGTYVMFAFLLDRQRSHQLRRIGEVCLGLYLMGLVYLINSVPEYRAAFVTHILGGDYMRYLVAVTLAGCALSFFSGFFLRDMGLCAAVTLLLVASFVDLDLGYWVSSGVHLWNQLRQVQNSACAVVGLLFIFCTMDNRLKVD
ncbi:transmembrane protein 101-like [Babylonia areolata]|uniref:transmembrane protein 101-like n=1 Tax=Babylonia areolata TaxID=304850 RepID=UPI003FD4A376